MSRHTPTKWIIDPNADNEVRSENDYPVACFNMKYDATRAIECVNAMEGIEDPQKFRDTWEAIKHLELDAYHKLQEEYQTLLKRYDRLREQYTALLNTKNNA